MSPILSPLLASLALLQGGAPQGDAPIEQLLGQAARGHRSPRTSAPGAGGDVIYPGYAVFRTPTEPRVSPGLDKPLLGNGNLEPGYFLVHFVSPITLEDKAWLDDLTSPVRRKDGSELARWYVPDNALAVWVDGVGTWLALQRSERTNWVGRYEPAYKIDPSLVPNPGEAFPLDVDLMPGHPAELVIRELESLGARVVEHVHHRGRATHDLSFLIVEAAPELRTRIAWIEGIRLVRQRGASSPLSTEGYPNELDSDWVAELARRAVTDGHLSGRLPGEKGVYDPLSVLIDLLAFDHPELVASVVAEELAGNFLEAPLKNVSVAWPGSSSPAVARGTSAALRRALEIHAERSREDSGTTSTLDGPRSGPESITFDVPSVRGFVSAGDEPDMYRFQGIARGRSLAVTLMWTDEPGYAGSGKQLTNDLDLVLRGPDGRSYRGNHFGASGDSVPGGFGDSMLNAEHVFLSEPQDGPWTVTVLPARGPYFQAQGYALVVSGTTPENGGSQQELNAPTTVTLQAAAGQHSRNGILGQGTLDQIRASDNNRFSLRDGERLTLAFDQAVPAGASVSAIRVFIEHHEERRVEPGDIVWGLGQGTLAAPSILTTASAPYRDGQGAEVLDTWLPNTLVPDANDLLIVIRNDNQNDDTVLDWVYIEVDYLLQEQGPRILSSPSPTGLVGEAYAYDADGRAEASGEVVTWAVGSPPAGFSIQSTTGLVTWTPTTAGSFPIRMRASNPYGTEFQEFVVEVADQPVLPSTLLPANPTRISYCPPERLAAGPGKAQQWLNVFLPQGEAPPQGWPLVLNNRAGGGIPAPPLDALQSTGTTAPLHAFVASGIAVVDFGVTGIGNGQGLFFLPGHPSGLYHSFDPIGDNPEKDAEWAIQWVKTQQDFPLDPENICTRGASHGAIIGIWAAMGVERARTSGSPHVRASTRVKGVLALQPPTSIWAMDQSTSLNSRMVGHFEQQTSPGVPATAFGQVSEKLQKGASIMGFSFWQPSARRNNETQAICLLYGEPVKRVGGAVADTTLDAESYPKLFNTLGQPYIHDSWAGYVFYKRLIDLSARSASFHASQSVFAVRDSTALPAPNDLHDRTFAGTPFGPEASAIAHEWVLRTLAAKTQTQPHGLPTR